MATRRKAQSKLTIDKIVISTSEAKKIELSVADARELRSQLNKLFMGEPAIQELGTTIPMNFGE